MEALSKNAFDTGEYCKLLEEEVAALEGKVGGLNNAVRNLQIQTLNGSGDFDFLDSNERRYASRLLKIIKPSVRKKKAEIRGDTSHHKTKRFKRFLDYLEENPYVEQIDWRNLPTAQPKTSEPYRDDKGRYCIDVTFKDDDFFARIEVKTTATSPSRAESVRALLEDAL